MHMGRGVRAAERKDTMTFSEGKNRNNSGVIKEENVADGGQFVENRNIN